MSIPFLNYGRPIAAMPIGTQLITSASGAATQLAPVITSSAGQSCYLSGFSISGGGANTSAVLTASLAGILSTPITYNLSVGSGATSSTPALNVVFPNPLIGSGSAITLTVPSFGTGNTNASVNLYGFSL